MNYRIIALLVCMFVVLSTHAQSVEDNDRTVGYRGIVELGCGSANNLNTAQTISSLNMQTLWSITTSQGVKYKGLFGGVGFGYNHSQRDKENMYLSYADVRYAFENFKIAPSIGFKAGVIYDPYWIESIQKYLALTGSVEVYDQLRFGLEGSVFSRPSRHFTANGLFVVSYCFGK